MTKKKILTLALTLALTLTAGAMVACNTKNNTEELSQQPTSSVDGNVESGIEKEEIGLSVERETVVLGVGDSYTLSATATGTEAPVYEWALDGDSRKDVVMITPAKNGSAVITGLMVGDAKIVVSTKIDGVTYWKTVAVRINAANNLMAEIPNLEMEQGYYTVGLSKIANPTNADDRTAVTPNVKVYYREELVDGAQITWESADTDVVKIVNGNFVAVAEGETELYGTYERAGETLDVLVKANVYLPEIALSGRATVEIEALKEIKVSETLSGEIESVSLGGNDVGTYSKVTKSIMLEKDRMPVTAAELGEDKQLVVKTSDAYYVLSADVYTMIIDTKAELDQMGAIAKACNPAAYLWDGYFVLGANIDYNGTFDTVGSSSELWRAEGRVNDWTNGLSHGFQGVFDGKGYNIDGFAIDEGTECGGLFGVLNAKGVIKNVSFTNASVAANSGLVCVAGAGLIENVYIQYNRIGLGSLHSTQVRYAGSFFLQGVDMGAAVRNCVIDITNAKFSNRAYVQVAGNVNAEYQRVFVIGGDEQMRSQAGVSTTYTGLSEFIEDKSAQMTIQKYDAEFWSVEGGVPLPLALYERAYKNLDVSFTGDTTSYVLAGTSYGMATNNPYVKYVVTGENVSVNGNVLVVDDGAENGAKVTVRAQSLFNENNYEERTFTIVKTDNRIDLTGDALAYIDLSTGKADFSAFNDVNEANIYYYMDTSGNAVDLNRVSGAGTMIAVSKDGLITFNYHAVTKIIKTLADLRGLTYKGTNIEGDYILGGNIDANGGTIDGAETWYNGSVGFMGTLDGRGYTISNLVVSGYGIFGALSGATIKNIRFENVTVGGALLAYNTFNTTIENVSVTVKAISGTYGLLTASYAYNTTFKDVTVDATAVKTTIKTLLGVAYRQIASENYPVFENVVIKAPTLAAFATGDWDKDPSQVDWPDGITRE